MELFAHCLVESILMAEFIGLDRCCQNLPSASAVELPFDRMLIADPSSSSPTNAEPIIHSVFSTIIEKRKDTYYVQRHDSFVTKLHGTAKKLIGFSLLNIFAG